MAQKPLSEQISLAIQNAVYEAADKVTTVVDEALEAFEDAAKSLEQKVSPQYVINLHGNVDPQKAADEIVAAIKAETAKQSPSKTGGREIENPTLEETLSVVYDYLVSVDPESRLHKYSKESAVEGGKSVIASEFKTHIYKEILGTFYTPSAEKV